jgi:DNA-binding beta-propeller fold protein YncE
MRTRRLVLAGSLSTLLLTGCASGAGVTPVTSAATGYSLYYIDAQVGNSPIHVIDAGTGRAERTLPVGTPSPDWSRLYAVSYDAGRTTLRAVDTRTADVIHQVSFDGGFALPAASSTGATGGLSPNGQWLVLQSQVEKNQTSFMLVNTSFWQRPRRVSLSGTFSFDAISNNGQRLFLIESLAATQPGHYRVRLYDVGAGALNPTVIIDKRELQSGSMTGTRLSGVFAPDGGWQYSLYVNENKGAFIHALNLDSTFAWCIDLPEPQGDQYLQTMWSLAIKPDGSALYAVNPSLARVARIDIGPDGPAPEVSQVSMLKLVSAAPATPGFFTDALAKEIQMGSAALSRDGRTLFATTFDGTVVIDLRSPTSQRRILDGANIESVVMSQDGAWFFASSWDGPSILRISPITGAALKILQTDTAWMLVRAEPR